MKLFLRLFLLFTIFSCSQKPKTTMELVNDLSNIPALSDKSSRCDFVEATKYNSVMELLEDFKTTSGFKDKYELNLRLGTHFIYQKQYDSALLFLNKASKIDSTLDYKLFLNKAICYSELGNFEVAIRTVDKAIPMCRNSISPMANKVYYLSELNKCEQAIELGLEILKRDTTELRVYGNMINCFVKLDKIDSIRKYLRYVDSHFDLSSPKLEKYKKQYL